MPTDELAHRGFKASETLLGIETCCVAATSCAGMRFKASETLLGIETYDEPYDEPIELEAASKPLKPF